MAPVHWTVRFIEVILETEKKTELEQVFGYCDQSRSVWVAPTPSGFAFLKFEDPLDATDAVSYMVEHFMVAGDEWNCRMVKISQNQGVTPLNP